MAGTAVLALASGLAIRWWRGADRWPDPVAPASPAAYVGGQTCAGCHRLQYELWKTSDHALAMQPADILVALAQYARAAGDRSAAAEWARKLVELSPTDGAARQLLEGLEPR